MQAAVFWFLLLTVVAGWLWSKPQAEQPIFLIN
jgi:hypothetical protein